MSLPLLEFEFESGVSEDTWLSVLVSDVSPNMSETAEDLDFKANSEKLTKKLHNKCCNLIFVKWGANLMKLLLCVLSQTNE